MPPRSPDVSVVIATRDRPELLRRAIRSFQAQSYANIREVVVVFDRSEVADLDDVRGEGALPIRTLKNTRTPGLAGARNSGIAVAEAELVAFCDDDDEWQPDKLERQVALWAARPEAVGVGTGMRLVSHGGTRTRFAPGEVNFSEFLDSRIFSIPSSGFLLRRSDVSDTPSALVGPVDEALPGSYGEDWDLLLRLTRNGPFINIPDPVVTVYWDRPSFFTSKWQGVIDGLGYLMEKYPEFEGSRSGFGRMASQLAFAYAASGERGPAMEWSRRSLRRSPAQVRAWAALAVAAKVVPPGTLVTLANSRGRGL